MVTGFGGYPTSNGSTESEKHDDILLISYNVCTSGDSITLLSKLFQVLAIVRRQHTLSYPQDSQVGESWSDQLVYE